MTEINAIPTLIRAGTDATKGTPSYIGETYYATDTQILYVATGIDTSGDWKVSGILATAKGDLMVATGAGVYARLPVGTDGQLVIADSTEPSGLKYVNVASATGKKKAMVNGNGSGSATIIGANSSGAIQFANEVHDNDAMVDLVSDDTIITVNTAGDFQCSFFMRLAVPISGSGSFNAQFRKNGSTFFGPSFTLFQSSSYPEQQLVVHFEAWETLDVDDTVELYVDNSTSGIILSSSGIADANMHMYLLEL